MHLEADLWLLTTHYGCRAVHASVGPSPVRIIEEDPDRTGNNRE